MGGSRETVLQHSSSVLTALKCLYNNRQVTIEDKPFNLERVFMSQGSNQGAFITKAPPQPPPTALLLSAQ